MKARKVVITLEVKTRLPMSDLRDKEWWQEGMTFDASREEGYPDTEVTQVQVNIIKPSK